MSEDPDIFAYHEILDRAHLVASMFEEHVLGHKVLDDHPEFKRLCQEAMSKLGEVYQAAGNLPGNRPPELPGNPE